MATIATRAILNNRNLTGVEINVRESVASFCHSYTAPFTSEPVKNIADRIGMDNGQCSTALAALERSGEIAREGRTIYLLRLDDDQLEKIAAKNYPLLVKLAEVGGIEADQLKLILTDPETAGENLTILERLKEKKCRQAIEMLERLENISREIENNSNKIENNSISDDFLLHFFLFSKLSISHLNLSYSQFEVETYSNLNEIYSTPLKEDNVLNGLRNVSKDFLEEVGQSPVQISSSGIGSGDAPSEDSDESTAHRPSSEKTKTEGPPSGEGTNGKPKTEEPRGGEGKPKRSDQPKTRKKTDEEAITRPDIQDDADWLALLKDHARFRGIDVLGKYRDMLDWCRKNKKTPSRLRLVNWLNQERDALPMKAVDLPPPAPNGKPAAAAPEKAVEKLTETERAEVLEWLKTKSDWAYFEFDFTPGDWAWLEERLRPKTEVSTV